MLWIWQKLSKIFKNLNMEFKSKEEIRKAFHYRVFRKIIYGDFLTPEDREIFVKWREAFNPSMILFSHYKNKHILFELVKSLGNSELIFGENIRWLYASKIEFILKYFYFYKVLEHKGKNSKGDNIEGYTFYKGLANFSHREAPPFAIQEKREWQNEYWTSKEEPEYLKKICGYDFGLDIDGKNVQDAYGDAKKVFELFTKFKIKFICQCSGRKGFHFIIPYEEFSEIVEPFDLDFTISFCKGLMLDLVKLLKLKRVDSVIYSSSRFLKCPFSLDSRNGRVILPLSNEEFIDFPNNPQKYFSLEYCHSLPNLGHLGEFRGRESNKKGFQEMLNYIGEKI